MTKTKLQEFLPSAGKLSQSSQPTCGAAAGDGAVTDTAADSALQSIYQSVVRIIVHEAQRDFNMPFKIHTSRMSTGTGFFIDANSHLLTCSHVVAHASHVYVEIPQKGRQQFPAEVLGVCPTFDLAVLRVLNYTNPRHCTLFPPEDTHRAPVHPGDTTLALGFPLGQENLKVTRGVVSGQQYSMYQIDTPINPGNSGGPLVRNGLVIGVNGAGILSANNIGYAVPIERFFLLGRLLFEKRRLIHFPNCLGIEYQNTTTALRRYLGCGTSTQSSHSCRRQHNTASRGQTPPPPQTRRKQLANYGGPVGALSGGIYIKRVHPGSVIQHLHLRQGDILCAINHQRLDQYGDLECRWMNQKMTLANLLATLPLNKRVVFTYWSNKKKRVVERGVILREHHLAIRNWFPEFEKIDYEIIGGMVLVPLSLDNQFGNMGQHDTSSNQVQPQPSPQLLKYTNRTHRHQPHLLISVIFPGSRISAMQCIPERAVLDTVNDRPVQTLAQLREAILHPVKTKGVSYMKVVTKDRDIAILPIREVVAEEGHLSDVYKFPPSDLVRALRKHP